MSKAMLSLSTFVTRLSWLPAARSKAQFTCRAACWSSVPTPKAHTTIPLLGRRRPSSLYCASGGRAALAGKTLQELGYKSVYNAGAFKDLAEAGLETEPA
jgi:rhodanese-related sulfurtransferase